MRRIVALFRAIRLALAPSPTGDVARLFLRAVPEIRSGRVEIQALARIRGRRTKIIVRSHDPVVDAVGACVGVGGGRVQWIVKRLLGERIDIIPWDSDPRRLIRRALAEAQVRDITLLPSERKARVLLEADLMSIASARDGANQDLASRTTGWRLELAFPEDSIFRSAEN